jgi:organic hydroperoxide reductase OsmC/OhrA
MADLITLELAQQQDFRFEVRFGATVPPLLTDEPAPLGGGTGPNPARLLGAAVANCLAASLLFALRKFRNTAAEPLRADATVVEARNEHNRLRIARIGVDLHLAAPAAALRSMERVLGQFEDFCIVTQSVRAGIAVDVRVLDADGRVLAPPATVPTPA